MFVIVHLRQFEIRPSEFVDVDLQDVAEVDQHVWRALRSAGDVQTGGDHVSVLPAPETNQKMSRFTNNAFKPTQLLKIVKNIFHFINVNVENVNKNNNINLPKWSNMQISETSKFFSK